MNVTIFEKVAVLLLLTVFLFNAFLEAKNIYRDFKQITYQDDQEKVTIPTVSNLQCPYACNCSNLENSNIFIPKVALPTVDCSRLNLSSIPSRIPHFTKRLDVSNNRIEWIEQSRLSNLTSLQELDLGDNVIEELDSNAFISLSNLKELILLKNRLKRVPLEAIPSEIQLLNLESNEITRVGKKTFSNLPKLRILMLGKNRIEFIDDEAFGGLDSLRLLELNDNNLDRIPLALSNLPELRELTLANNRISQIDVPFHKMVPKVTHLQLRGNPIHRIHLEGFSHLPHLKKLILSDVRNMTELPHLNGTSELEVLRIDRCSIKVIPQYICQLTPKLRSLDLRSNKLEELPDLKECNELRVLDLSMNRIRTIGNGEFYTLEKLHDLHLHHNYINSINEETFIGLKSLQNLDLSSNDISQIDKNAFAPLKKLEDLNLGNNVFSELPTNGLEQIVELKTHNNPNLKEFPGPALFPNVRRLVLSYAYHCCQFMPSTSRSSNFLEPSIQETVWYPTDNGFGNALSALNLTELWPGIVNMSNRAELANDFWKTFGPVLTTGASVAEDGNSLEEIISTKLAHDVSCIPLPGPFLPCNDLFDWWTLRCGVWVVFLLALMGNGTVVFVLIFARSKMDVPRFLVCNLAIADFFMGVYLGFLAVIDAATFGEFRKFAIQWQLSSACQMAGFLGVLSSELSVYTLVVITMERHYVLTHAMHLNKRLSLRHAIYIMIVGWLFALIMALLPLFGVSDYRKFAVCLPFEIGDTVSLGYVVFLMFANGVAFTILMGCYLKMYCSIRGSHAWNANDTIIAKRMSILVFTDLLCWFPIAFFSLTAVFGLQLVSLEEAKVFTVFILPLNSCCNPFLYAILTKQFKKDCVLICKAIEESRVTRGIGRCRHSSNFSNRQTAPNTGSLVDKSSKDGQPCICNSGTHHSVGDENGNAKYRTLPIPFTTARMSYRDGMRRMFIRFILCKGREKESRGQSDDYRMRNVRRYLYNNEVGNYAGESQKHKRHASVSSDNFSSSRSDSWRMQNRCGIPLRMLEARRRNSWAVTRKPSQDSNLSNSRNDSSATSNSTATWRLSRSSVSSDAASHSGGRSSFKRISNNPGGAGSSSCTATSTSCNAGVRGRPLPSSTCHQTKNWDNCGGLGAPSVIAEEEISAIEMSQGQSSSQIPQVSFTLPTQKAIIVRDDVNKKQTRSKKTKGKRKKKKKRKVNVDRLSGSSASRIDEGYIDDEEASAKIATNRPRLVRQSAFFSDEVVIEPEVCPVHGPLIPGTYDDENDEDKTSIDMDDETTESSSSEDSDVEEEADDSKLEAVNKIEEDLTSASSQRSGQYPKPSILRRPSVGIAFVILPRRLSSKDNGREAKASGIVVKPNQGVTTIQEEIPIEGGRTSPCSSTALLLPTNTSNRRKFSEQPVKFYVVPARDTGILGKWHSMSSVEGPSNDASATCTSPLLQPSRSHSPRGFKQQTCDVHEIPGPETIEATVLTHIDESDEHNLNQKDSHGRRVSFQLP